MTSVAALDGHEGLQAMADGILPAHEIMQIINADILRLDEPPIEGQIQPASIDLRLGSVAYRVRASFLPGAEETVGAKLDDLTVHRIDISEGAVLETGCVYVVPLLESLDLPKGISAAANPKSSTGRLDVFTRVIADGIGAFDQVPAGYQGRLLRRFVRRHFLFWCARVRGFLSYGSGVGLHFPRTRIY